MIDALDTLYIMGFHEEFDRGVKLVEKLDFAGANVRPSLSFPLLSLPH